MAKQKSFNLFCFGFHCFFYCLDNKEQNRTEKQQKTVFGGFVEMELEDLLAVAVPFVDIQLTTHFGKIQKK